MVPKTAAKTYGLPLGFITAANPGHFKGIQSREYKKRRQHARPDYIMCRRPPPNFFSSSIFQKK
jgi:hypothetical protein